MCFLWRWDYTTFLCPSIFILFNLAKHECVHYKDHTIEMLFTCVDVLFSRFIILTIWYDSLLNEWIQGTSSNWKQHNLWYFFVCFPTASARWTCILCTLDKESTYHYDFSVSYTMFGRELQNSELEDIHVRVVKLFIFYSCSMKYSNKSYR